MASDPEIGEFLLEFDSLDERDRKARWRAHGGDPFPGEVGRVRRLGRVIPRERHPLPFKIPFFFTMDGPGTYFGDDVEGLMQIFAGESATTRLLWKTFLMSGKPSLLVCDVALGRTTLASEHDRVERWLHEVCAWARVPILTPARFYYGYRRWRYRLDSYEVYGVRFFPAHGHYTVVLDRRRIRPRRLYASLAAYRERRFIEEYP